MRFNPRQWLHRHSLRILAIRDTPESIAGGVAIGIFFGFMPLFGLKTLSCILLAWVTRSNLLAAVIASTAHDILLPLMPAIYFWEYGVGYWLLSHPHHWPHELPAHHGNFFDLRSWVFYFFGAGKPLLVGGALCAGPFAALAFVLTRRFVAKHQRKRHARNQLLLEEDNEHPSW